MALSRFSTILIIFLLCAGCGRGELVRNTSVGGALGTSYSIIYLAEGPLDLQREIDSVFQVMNQSMSTYISDSDISRINRGENDVIVDQMFREVFELSKEVHRNTQGYFDPTVGILVDAWGFGPGEQVAMDSSQVDSILQYVGLDKVSLNKEGLIIKETAGVRLDFNAIAKGYAIDRLAALLDTRDIDDYLIEVGGELVARGENRIRKKQWVVGIDDPQVVDGRRLKLTINLKDRAMASSGNYRKFRIDSVSGKKYVHTIDPISGYTKNAAVLSATVLAPDCATADAYATAFMAMELANSKALLEKESNLEAYIIYLDEAGETREFMTAGFKKQVL